MCNKTDISRRSFLKHSAVLGGAAATAVATSGLLTAPPEAEAAEDMSATFAASRIIESEQYEDKTIVDIDLLIIGSGYAGMWAALTAAEQGVASIAMVDKGAIAQSSVASMTAGSTSFVLEDDDMYGCMEELVKVSEFLSRQDFWEDMLSTSPARYNKILSWGVNYLGDRIYSDGNTYTAISTGIEYQGKQAGKAMIAALVDQVTAHGGIRYFSKTMVTQLLKEGESVVGAAGFNRINGNTIAFRSKATILAAGKCSFKGQHAMGEVETGDSYAMAYAAGAVL
ncbi:MAG: FAD-binding protein, partial [Coriobacteriales bacterium]|nr:FAD-binding protein [Coriobacteriales bacterium]